MTLPKRKEKEVSPDRRWRSDAHRRFVRTDFCCANCGTDVCIEAAHVSMGGIGGMGLKTDDWRCVPLCGPGAAGKGCHGLQHRIGEPEFWRRYAEFYGQTVEDLIASLCKASPKRAEIERMQRGRANAQ